MKKFTFLLLIISFVSFALAQQVVLLNFATGLTSITDIKNAGDDRLFVVEQPGRIKIIDLNGNVNPANFLNIQNKVLAGGERGLLGLAFSPDYANDGYFYVNYTADPTGNTIIARYSVSATDPNKADSLSEMILLTINQPFSNHNGGHITFGPDGYLYIGMGDGGSGGDPQNNGQNPMALLGKMLRIDVSGGGAYSVPASNPFVNTPGYQPEIWSLGLRNPWRFSFDRITDDMWIADVGQGQWEEINFQPASSAGGGNWGWRCYEGNVVYNGTGCLAQSNYDFPVHVYPHSGANSGCSVSGGYVYRGAEYPSLFGRYFYADYCSGLLGSINVDNGCNGNFVNTYHGNIATGGVSTFGEDRYGNLYIGGLSSGVIKKVADTAGCAPVAFITCEDSLTVCDISYTLSTPLGNGYLYQWYHDGNAVVNGNLSELVATQNGNYNVVVVNTQFCTSQSQWVYLNFVTPPVVSFTGLATDYCENDTMVSLTGSPAGGVFSGNGISGNNFDPSVAGAGLHSITYTYTDTTTGCSKSFSVDVNVFALPLQPSITQNTDTLFTNVNGSIQWLDSALTPISGATGTFFIPQQEGTYYVQFIDTNGCVSVSDPYVFLLISATEINNELNFLIYPNPANEFVTVSVSNKDLKQIRVIDQLGKIVFEKSITGSKFEINTAELSDGVYYLFISNEKNSKVSKLVLLDN